MTARVVSWYWKDQIPAAKLADALEPFGVHVTDIVTDQRMVTLVFADAPLTVDEALKVYDEAAE